VLQYLDDGEVRQAFKEFARVLGPGGILVLHVKNASSLYWTSLGVAKKLKSLLGRAATAYHVRPFRWYVNELESLNCRVLGYKSFNLLTLDRMPRKLTYFLQGAELRHHGGWLFRIPFVRRHGADLKIRAAVLDCHAGHSETTSISPQALGPNR
jgi:SAM-dependent methyltransferase